MRIQWQGAGTDELGIDARSGRIVVRIDPRYFRPSEVSQPAGRPLQGAAAAWLAGPHHLDELIREMVSADAQEAQRDALVTRESFKAYACHENRDSRVFVAGHRGLVGSAIVRRLQAEGWGNLVVRARSELDLRDQTAVADFFASERPEYVFLAAAKVGGIHANEAYPADFIRDNLQIQLNVIDSACRHGTRKLLLLGSSCIYPRLAPQPMGESSLLTSALEPTNQWYAVAKIAGVKLCEAYRRHHGFDAISAMPTNLYGPGDNFDLLNSHVMSALLRHMHEAKLRRERTLAVWGTGTSRRKFLHVDTTLRTRASSSCVATTGRSPSISGSGCVGQGTG